MKRMFISSFAALLLLVFFAAVGSVEVRADNHTYSEDVVTFIKSWEGFSANAFWDVSQWTIGYGTNGVPGQTITEAEADSAMRAHLAVLDAKINTFASQNGLSLTQYQHDALLSFSFNCGTEWMDTPGRFRTAIVQHSTGNDFLYAISLWANINSVPDRGLLNRRMSEANLYMNGVYSKSVPAAYTYVIYDPNGGSAGNGGEDKMQGYLAADAVAIAAAAPTRAGYLFAGWSTDPNGGAVVTQLNSATAGKTLYAMWGMQATVKDEYVNIRSGAGTSYPQIGRKMKGESVVIFNTVQVGTALWGQCSDGWLVLEYTDYNGSGISQQGGTPGTVVCSNYVYVRSGAGTNYPVAGSLPNGTQISILEITTVNGIRWGRTASGWVCLTYVRMAESAVNGSNAPANGSSLWADNSGNTSNDTGAYTNGVVTGSNVNVRANPGMASPVSMIMNAGSAIRIYEQTTKDNIRWGRTDQGWICMNYVRLDNNDAGNTAPTAESVIETGSVAAGTNLNVRSGAGTAYAKVTSLAPGTQVNIYEKTTVNGQPWGRIGANQWVCLTYVNTNNQTNAAQGVSGSGIVICSGYLNVRAAAGTGSAIVSRLQSGSSVTIYETTAVGGIQWGRTGNGWVCMRYIQMTGSGSGSSGIQWN